MGRIIKIPLDVIRHTGSYRDSTNGNRTVDKTPECVAGVLFSIQPFSKGSTQHVLPEGIMANDAQVLFSDVAIKQASQKTKLKADRVEIDDETYVAFKVANWSRHGSRADHYESLFIREGILSQFNLLGEG
jgi:hypothetical protein